MPQLSSVMDIQRDPSLLTVNVAMSGIFWERLGPKLPYPISCSPRSKRLWVRKLCAAAAPSNPSARGHFSAPQAALSGAFANLNGGLNNCFNLTGKLSFREGWDLFTILEASFRKHFYSFVDHMALNFNWLCGGFFWWASVTNRNSQRKWNKQFWPF